MLRRLRRSCCGWSTKIHTDPQGRETHLWVFCDTPMFRRDGLSQYNPLGGGLFKTNSASLARYDPNDTTVPARDQQTRMAMSVRTTGEDVGTQWAEFIPRPTIPGCTAPAYSASWPGSAVTLAGEQNATVHDTSHPATAVVLIFFQDLCFHSPTSVTRHGSGVAAWYWSSNPAHDPHQQFTPTDPAHSNGLQAQVLQRDLFGSPANDLSFQYGATVEDLPNGAGRYLRLLNCHKRARVPADQPKTGCELAQVRLSGDWNIDRERLKTIGRGDEPTLQQWRYFRGPGTTWGYFTNVNGEGAAPTDAYDITQTADAVDGRYVPEAPDGHTSMVRRGDRWLMISMQAGLTQNAVVRTSRSLTGTWSPGRVLQLPSDYCEPSCYAPVLHPQLDTGNELGLTYVDTDGLRVCTTDVAPGQTCTLVGKQRMRTATIPLLDFPNPP